MVEGNRASSEYGAIFGENLNQRIICDQIRLDQFFGVLNKIFQFQIFSSGILVAISYRNYYRAFSNVNTD